MAGNFTQQQVAAVLAQLFGGTPTQAQIQTFFSIDQTLGDAAMISAISSSNQAVEVTIPIIQIIQLATGLSPTSGQLSGWVNYVNGLVAGGDTITEALTDMANHFVQNNNAFIAKYGVGGVVTSDSLIKGIYANAFGVAPTQAQINAWSVNSPGFILEQFAVSNVFSHTVAPFVQTYLTDVIDSVGGQGAVFPNGSIFNLVPAITQTLTLTNAQDTVVSGLTYHDPILGNVTVGSNGGVQVNAPLTGPFGNQASLDSGDAVSLTGTGNILEATFNGTSTAVGLTLQGLQSWFIQNVNSGHGHTVTLLGTPGSISGVNAITYDDNTFGNSLEVGSPVAGIVTTANGFTLTVQNAQGGFNSGVDLNFASADFTGNDTINVIANVVGNRPDFDFNDGVDISAGFQGFNALPATGFATWVVNSKGSSIGSINNLRLGNNGATNATTLRLIDDGTSAVTTIWASFASGSHGAADWANLATLDLSGTSGTVFITGGENGNQGLLGANTTALTTVIGGSGADVIDLSHLAWTDPSLVSINGGGNIVDKNIFGDIGTGIELSNTEINALSLLTAPVFASWSGVNILYDVASPSVGGTINMADYPGTEVVSLLNSHSGTTGINQNTDLLVTNATNGLTFNFNNTNENGHNFEIDGAATNAAGSTVTVNYGNGTNNYNANSNGSFTVQNFDNVNVNVHSGGINFYHTGLFVVATNGGHETLTITSDINLNVGNTTTGVLGSTNIALFGGTLLKPESGVLDLAGTGTITIGVTNAHDIHVTTTGAFLMGPDDAIDLTNFVLGPGGLTPSGHVYTGITVTAVTGGSNLQGSLDAVFNVGNDTLTDTGGNVFFFGDGGADHITMGTGNINEVFTGVFQINGNLANPPGGAHAQAITNNLDQSFQGFWGSLNFQGAHTGTNITASTEANLSTLTGFNVPGGDEVVFNADAWNGGAGGAGALVSQGGNPIVNGAATMQLVGAGITVSAGVNFVLYTEGGLTSAADLANLLAGAGSIGLTVGAHQHMLFAYDVGSDIHIADVDFLNGAAGSTHNRSIVASDMYDIVGGNNGTTSSLAILGAHQGDVQFVHIA